MRYTLKNGKTINIPDAEIKSNAEVLGLTKEEAIEVWLEDNDYEVNEEQVALDAEASKVKLNLGAKADTAKPKTPRERTVKVSDEKKELFDSILTNLDRTEGVSRENVKILKENKLIQVQIGEKIFKIDVIEQRPPKK